MFEQNSYQAYVDETVVGMSPVSLVTALYQGAIDACMRGQECFESNDIMGRSRAVNKIVSILTELMVSLNHQVGGDMSSNLKRLYSYMQQRALTAHLQKDREALREVEGLLRDMIEAWHKVAEKHGEGSASLAEGELIEDNGESTPNQPAAYGIYGDAGSESLLGRSFSF